MKLDANVKDYEGYQHIVVVFNATNAPVTFTDGHLQGLHLHLHPVQRHSADPITRQSTFNTQAGSATVAALTTAVFVGN
jgi:pullulanase